MSVSAHSTVPGRRLMRYADSLLPQRFVDSTKGEFMEDVVRCSMATGPYVEDPPDPSPPPPPPPPPSPPYLSSSLATRLTRRCAFAGVTEGVDERVDDATTSSAVESFLSVGGVLAPKIDVDGERRNFTRVWLPLEDDARRRGRRLHEGDAASPFWRPDDERLQVFILEGNVQNMGEAWGACICVGLGAGQKH